MSKSLTLSMSLALALGFSGVVKAGGHFGGGSGCATCGMASPQGVVAAPQASSQGYVTETAGCDTCAPAKKKCSFLACLKPKPKMYTYEWVLKKKKVHGHAKGGCDTCGGATESYVTPSAQGYASPQGTYAAPQASYAAPQANYGSGQASVYPTSDVKAVEPTGDAVPPAPSAPAPSAPAAPAPPAPAGAQSSLLFLNGAGN